MHEADPPGRAGLGRRAEPGKGTVRSALRREDAAEHDGIDGREDDLRGLRRQDGEHVRVRWQAGQRDEIVGAIDGRAVVDVVRARDDHRPDPAGGEALELARDSLDGPPRLGVRVEQVARDEHEVDLLREGEVDRRTECVELALSLGGCAIAEVRMASAEMDVGQMQQAEHSRPEPPGTDRGAIARGRLHVARRRRCGASEEPPLPSLADSSLARHCDRFDVTVASRCGGDSSPSRRPISGPVRRPADDARERVARPDSMATGQARSRVVS